MKGLRKVVWAEGVFLGQQHFQLWDRYLEKYQHLRAKSLSPFNWGILSHRIDSDSLANGQYKLLACDVIFPDGRLVSYEGNADEALSCQLDASGDHVEVMLAIPSNDSVSGIAGYQNNSRLGAWAASFDQIPDEHDPARVREVMVGRPNLRLFQTGEPQEHFVSVKLAELVRGVDGAFALNKKFVPPVCHLEAAPAASS
ncbi:hypothetical protein CAI21_08400 [Alkalilimnicola ehrlichii]|uniref:Type VI secretion system-associated protein n=1 Tax=Alkalilimnicola ehrlichii TaxID=351052 RepID=A0A3E0WW74_9GAMM|nr:type VI secretion system baseplate subunit TssK [Alkalilimnicola ehrlichii]RFA29845.1 hypothetical protein CAI21_08400 [Alkalilimnicola ehrlichii]RFA36433.1 hypothetical protein CAL65_10665 [Alkalilimnicola ehrlichii]